MSAPLHLTLHPAAALDRVAGAVRIGHWGRRIVFDDPSPGTVRALVTLAADGATESVLDEIVVSIDGPAGQAHWLHTLDIVREAGALQYALRCAGRDVAVLRSAVRGFLPKLPSTPPTEPVRLSRFTYLRAHQGALLIGAPISRATIELCDPLAAAAVAVLRGPARVADIVAAVQGLSPAVIEGLVRLLQAAGMLAANADEAWEERESALEHWGFFDLLFHWRSRWGTHVLPTGGTFPLGAGSLPLPAVKPTTQGPVVELPRPDLRALESVDPPFVQVLEQRRSVRTYATDPVSLEQLGEFLFRVGRVRRIDTDDRLPYPISNRPYPSGGACYPLELYPVVARCTRLARGVYHYDPVGNRLEGVAEWDDGSVASLVADARLGEGYGPVQVLIVVTARFRRTMWKYEGMAYATILKDVGVLYQTMYLVATAMRFQSGRGAQSL
jgi:SagB-type dehydrogenase family enzyme